MTQPTIDWHTDNDGHVWCDVWHGDPPPERTPIIITRHDWTYLEDGTPQRHIYEWHTEP